MAAGQWKSLTSLRIYPGMHSCRWCPSRSPVLRDGKFPLSLPLSDRSVSISCPGYPRLFLLTGALPQPPSYSNTFPYQDARGRLAHKSLFFLQIRKKVPLPLDRCSLTLRPGNLRIGWISASTWSSAGQLYAVRNPHNCSEHPCLPISGWQLSYQSMAV